MNSYPLRERRKRASRDFYLRVTLLVLLFAAIAYAGWFAPWAKPLMHRVAPVETVR